MNTKNMIAVDILYFLSQSLLIQEKFLQTWDGLTVEHLANWTRAAGSAQLVIYIFLTWAIWGTPSFEMLSAELEIFLANEKRVTQENMRTFVLPEKKSSFLEMYNTPYIYRSVKNIS